jgi:hypothetical protein
MRNAPSGEIVKNATVENTKNNLDEVSLSPLQHDEFANRCDSQTVRQPN